jgi:hypothetical protein
MKLYLSPKKYFIDISLQVIKTIVTKLSSFDSMILQII